jgi:hypothetical protein
MQTVVKILASLILFLGAMVAFFPGKEGYFKLEALAAKEQIYINEKQVRDIFGGVEVKDGTLFAKGLKVGTFDSLLFRTALVASYAQINRLKIDNDIASFLPVKGIDSIRIMHTVLKPERITISVTGSFGTLKGEGLWNTRHWKLYVVDKNRTETIKSYLKRDKKGWYYEVRY